MLEVLLYRTSKILRIKQSFQFENEIKIYERISNYFLRKSKIKLSIYVHNGNRQPLRSHNV